MNTNSHKSKNIIYNGLSYKVNWLAMKVHNTLGPGFSHRDGFAIRKGLHRVIIGK